jgi:hypothetical protein
MNENNGRVLDYLAYRNKIRAAEWAERLWRQHLDGTPRDLRFDEDRQRYVDLTARLEVSRSMARHLHARRTRHAPSFARLVHLYANRTD